MRVLVVAREQINVERIRAGALATLVCTIGVGVEARTPLSRTQITTIAAWRTRAEDLARTTARAEVVRLARRAGRVISVSFSRYMIDFS
jgi:transposase